MTEPASAPRLGLGSRISYGIGSVAEGVGGVALSTATINFYLISVVGLRPAIVGTVLLISLVIDAVLDPFIGRWSDTFRSRWGRRHPFMYASALPIALATILLWSRPAGISLAAMPVYVLGSLIVLRLAGGFYKIPSDALAPELAPDYHQRTRLIGWRYLFGILGGGGMGLLTGLVFLRKDASHPLGQYDPAAYAHFGLAAAIVVFLAILVSSLATHRYIPALSLAPVRRQSLGETVREMIAILANRSLLAIMISGLISGVGGGISAATGSFMFYYFWGLTPQSAAVIGIWASPAAIIGVVLAPIVSRALDKKRTMLTVFTLSIFTGVIPVSMKLLGLLPANPTGLTFAVLILDIILTGALGLIGFIIIGSMVADVAEDAAVKTGVRAEGLLFATNGLLPKVTTGLGALLGNLMLEFVHFPVGLKPGLGGDVHIDPQIIRNLALISLPVGAVLNILSVTVLGFYRIDRGSHEANLEALKLASMIGEPPALPAGSPPMAEPGTFLPPL